MVIININIFPYDKSFTYDFCENKSFEDLKKDLIKRQIIEKEAYYIEINDDIINDDMIIKEKGIRDYMEINIVKNDYLKIILELKQSKEEIQTMHSFVLASDFKVIRADENKIVKV